jgi:hypothetical protein
LKAGVAISCAKAGNGLLCSSIGLPLIFALNLNASQVSSLSPAEGPQCFLPKNAQHPFQHHPNSLQAEKQMPTNSLVSLLESWNPCSHSVLAIWLHCSHQFQTLSHTHNRYADSSLFGC